MMFQTLLSPKQYHKANVDFEKDILNENLFKNIHSKYASHALTSFNRKYIYIPYKIFLPLTTMATSSSYQVKHLAMPLSMIKS